ncbi:NUDIX hydrolase family protein [Heterostelium album PN500]|uniref:m7GpppN-mRNA hydrolase NUDT17 n=1 Tax=Heterostelium pallidum (strain ATCC 26659 / Pp 5 / PN500) TaxID=670386 RepID=D3BB52_HETP5|nr:NUDIX hydrolase family protein [Heterostelium album PN500]EFA81789.1 NUDIX hydrolase family protein [Heterostelium album PN500]|eukprot:XP_020433906.1 NUDIX hydrolase family protein [Heterostelium album PN500]
MRRLSIQIIILLFLLLLINLILLKKIQFNPTTSFDNINNKKDKDIDKMNQTAAAAKRIYWPIVYSYDDNNKYDNIPWNKCLLHHMSIENTIGMIRIEFDRTNGRLILSNPKEPVRLTSDHQIETYTTLFAHPKSCPFSTLLRSNSDKHKQLQQNITLSSHTIKVGVSILIEDVFGRVFLTKRAKSMRIFPSVWVLPGGHMEKGETIFETALRELKEETGLVLSDSAADISVIGAFESTFPQYLDDDRLPSDHHVVLFTKIKLHSDISNLQKVELEPDEVEVAAWVPTSSLAHLLTDISTELKRYLLQQHLY